MHKVLDKIYVSPFTISPIIWINMPPLLDYTIKTKHAYYHRLDSSPPYVFEYVCIADTEDRGTGVSCSLPQGALPVGRG